MDFLADFNLSLEEHQVPAILSFDEEMVGTGDLLTKAVTLESIYQEVSRTGTVSRTQVEYLKDTCGVDFGPRYPLGSFTAEPSSVNLKVAQENFVQEFFTSLQSFLKKVIAVIIGILKWIWDTLSGGKKLRENIETVTENARIIDGSNRKAKQKIAEAGQGSELEALLASKKAQIESTWEANWTKWRFEYINHGRYMSFLEGYSDLFFSLFPSVAARSDLFKELITIKEIPDDFAREAELTSRFYRAAQTIPVGHFVSIFIKDVGDFDTGGRPVEEMNFLDVASNFQSLAQHLMSTKAEGTQVPTPEAVLNVLMTDGKTSIKPLLHNSEQEARLTNTIIDGYKTLASTKPQQQYSESMRQRYKAVIDSMTMEIRGLQMSVATFTSLEASTASMVKEIADGIFETNKIIEEFIEKMDAKDGNKKEILSELKKSREGLKRLR